MSGTLIPRKVSQKHLEHLVHSPFLPFTNLMDLTLWWLLKCHLCEDAGSPETAHATGEGQRARSACYPLVGPDLSLIRSPQTGHGELQCLNLEKKDNG